MKGEGGEGLIQREGRNRTNYSAGELSTDRSYARYFRSRDILARFTQADRFPAATCSPARCRATTRIRPIKAVPRDTRFRDII